MKTWADLEFWSSEEYSKIKKFLEKNPHYPEKENIFKSLRLTPYRKVRVVILGQDPYHDGSATGLAFSSNKPVVECPPSLRNIFSEYCADLKKPMPRTGNLTAWAKRGVLLINSCWTVEPHNAGSHVKLGWIKLTQEILQAVAKQNPDVVFILWGNDAVDTASFVRGAHRVVSSHPSPLSYLKGKRPFVGSRPFTRCNAILQINKSEPINWTLDHAKNLEA